MKYLVFAVFLAVAVVVSGQPNKAPAKEEKSREPLASAAPAVNPKQSTTERTDKPNEDSLSWCAAIKRPEWWLVLIAAVTRWVIWRQAREMSRATEEMKASSAVDQISAKAAE